MKIRKIQDIGRDKEGHPQLPVQLGIITLESLGEISTASGFHNDRYIYPIGFTTSRQYLSMIDAEKTVTYRSTIISTPDGPKFQVVAEDDPTHPIIAQSATGAWTAVLRAANKLRNKEHSNSASGPDYFGLSQPTIINLIQGLPNADKCTQYTFQKFEIASKKADRTTNKTKKAIRARELSSEEARDNKPFADPMEMSVLEGNIPNMESLNAKVIDFNPNQIQPVVDNSASGMN
ncbi:F/Y rich C-terminus-domain-containing protein [Globomyces pollinis-pini]|nr:F/Y rich C-terminus-domain-containing protein [Globomyces pollinis-pini]